MELWLGHLKFSKHFISAQCRPI